MQTANATASMCGMCGATLSPFRKASPICRSLLCVRKYAALPDRQKCASCARPLEPPRWAHGVCANPACGVEETRRRLADAAAAADKLEIERATRSRHRVGRAKGVPAEQRAGYRLAVLPLNVNRTSQLPEARRRAFEAHLRTALAKAREQLAAGEPCPPRHAPPEPDEHVELPPAERAARAELVVAACTGCRGWCCLPGGDHAFISAHTMMQYVSDHPDHDDDTIVARYLGFLGARTVNKGCVFQGDQGCTLQAELRSAVCRNHYCDSVRTLFNHHEAGDPVRAFLVHRQGQRMVKGRFVDVPVAASGEASAGAARSP